MSEPTSNLSKFLKSTAPAADSSSTWLNTFLQKTAKAKPDSLAGLPKAELPPFIKFAQFPADTSDLRQLTRDTGDVTEQELDALMVKDVDIPAITPLLWDAEVGDAAGKGTHPDELVAKTESYKLFGRAEKAGMKPDLNTLDALFTVTQAMSTDVVDGLADAHEGWKMFRESLARGAANAYTHGSVDFNLGLALLDIAAKTSNYLRWVGLPLVKLPGDKELRIPGIKDITRWTGGMSEKEMAEYENKLFPTTPIKHDGEVKSFSSGLTAGLWLLGQRAMGTAEYLGGKALGAAGTAAKVHGNYATAGVLDAKGAELQESGQDRTDYVYGQIPALVQGRSEWLSPLAGVEAAIPNGEEVLDTFYRDMEREGGAVGQGLMLALATLDAAVDVVGDPLLIAGTLVGRTPTMLRSAANNVPAWSKKIADITSKAASGTKRMDDVVDATQAAKRHYDLQNAARNKEIADNLSMTGRRMVRQDTDARTLQARRHYNNERIRLHNTFSDPTPDEMVLRTPRRSPLALAPPKTGGFSSTLRQELHEMRVRALYDGPDDIAQWNNASGEALQQRTVQGVSTAEQVGDGLNMIVKGAGIDDVTLTPFSPEYYTTPVNGPISPLPWKNPDLVADMTKAERNMLKSYNSLPEPNRPDALSVRPQRLLVIEEDLIKRNITTAHQMKNKKAVKQYERALELNRRAQKNNLPIEERNVQFDDIWAPPEQPSVMSTPERLNRWLGEAGDHVLRSIYPGAVRYHGMGIVDDKMLRGVLGGTGTRLNTLREPQRFFDSVEPGMWDKIRGDRLRYHQSTTAWIDEILRGSEEAGVIVSRKKYNPLKHWAPYKINKAANRKLFDVLDTRVGTPEYEAASKAAGPKIMKLHDNIRKQLDTAADMQGIRDADRYISGYIKHFYTADDFADGARPPEYDGIPHAQRIFASHLEKRTGHKNFEPDALMALELYGRSMHKKLILEPSYNHIVDTCKRLGKEKGVKAITDYGVNYVNALRGKPTLVGKSVDNFLSLQKVAPNAIDRGLMGITTMLYTGILTGNPRYAFMQIATALPTTAMRYGAWRTAKSLFSYATREGQQLTKQAGTYQAFQDIFESPSWRKVSRIATEVVPSGFVTTNAGAERLIRGMTFEAARDMYMTKFGFATWREAVEAGYARNIMYQSLRSCEESCHMFGPANRNPYLSRTGQGIASGGTQFMSFGWKQTDELLHNFGRGGVEGLGRIGEYMAVSGWLVDQAAHHFGIDATRYTGAGYAFEEIENLRSPFTDALFNLSDMLQAHNERDPEEVERTTRRVIDSFKGLVPFMTAFESASKAGHRLKTGEVQRAGGNKVYSMDFAETLPDPGQADLQSVARSLRPERESVPRIGSELPATITMLPNMRETLGKRALAAARRENARLEYNAKRFIDELYEAAMSGDEGKLNDVLKKLDKEAFIRLSPNTSMLESKMEASQMSQFLRQLKDTPPHKKDLIFKVWREYGIAPWEGE